MTTIVSVRRNGTVAVGGDGQVTMGQSSILKDNARKVRRLFKGRVIAGFAGSTADAFTLLDLFEKKLEAHQGILERACVALVKDWRTDKMLRKLEAIMIVADKEHSFLISGTGDVVKMDDDILGEICVFTNQNHIIETINVNEPDPAEKKAQTASANDANQGAAWSAD